MAVVDRVYGKRKRSGNWENGRVKILPVVPSSDLLLLIARSEVQKRTGY